MKRPTSKGSAALNPARSLALLLAVAMAAFALAACGGAPRSGPEAGTSAGAADTAVSESGGAGSSGSSPDAAGSGASEPGVAGAGAGADASESGAAGAAASESAASGSAAAQQAAPGSGTAPKKETLRAITYFSGSDQWVPTWKAAIEEYMAQNPHITISDESLPTSGQNDVFRPKMNADIAAGTPADVALYFNGSDAKPLLESGLYVTWEPYLEADPAWKAQFSSAALPTGEWDGQLIALPYIGFFEGLVYNKRMFDEQNLEAPTNWGNIVKAVEAFAKTDTIPIANTLMSMTALLEVMLLAEVGPEGQARYFDDAWAPAIDKIKTLYEMGAFPKDAATVTENDIRPLFSDGKAAMSFNGSWVLNALRDNPDMRITALSPAAGSSGKEGAIIAGFGSGWYMSKAAAERSEESLKFIKYMCSPEILARFIAVGGSPSMQVEMPANSEPVMLSAMEMVSGAKSMSSPVDAQVPREAFNKLSMEIIYVCDGQKTSLELLKEAREMMAQQQ
ncbi:MAG: extracellular solute-binding protein [Clostridiales bacterium]|jgi:raffinose/stachyose/melibiose transport system substrate-binding protein|nr:extracellular solute-binding protein [Clostridiales bacterium]